MRFLLEELPPELFNIVMEFARDDPKPVVDELKCVVQDFKFSLVMDEMMCILKYQEASENFIIGCDGECLYCAFLLHEMLIQAKRLMEIYAIIDWLF